MIVLSNVALINVSVSGSKKLREVKNILHLIFTRIWRHVNYFTKREHEIALTFCSTTVEIGYWKSFIFNVTH